MALGDLGIHGDSSCFYVSNDSNELEPEQKQKHRLGLRRKHKHKRKRKHRIHTGSAWEPGSLDPRAWGLELEIWTDLGIHLQNIGMNPKIFGMHDEIVRHDFETI